jgi:hypothetical protein
LARGELLSFVRMEAAVFQESSAIILISPIERLIGEKLAFRCRSESNL